MLLLDETCPTVWENVALDECLLLEAEAGSADVQVIRFWDARAPFVVLGRSSKAKQEVQLELAHQENIPVVRRCSGGATVMADKGCIFYSVLLSLETSPHLRMLDQAHQFVMGKILQAVQQLRPEARLDGTCDIVVGDRKVSGNSLRVQRNWMLYHGTLLVDMDLKLISKYLRHPPREPEYRGGREHAEFLANLEVDQAALRRHLADAWNVTGSFGQFTHSKVQELVQNKYALDSWNLQR